MLYCLVADNNTINTHQCMTKRKYDKGLRLTMLLLACRNVKSEFY